MSYSKQGISSLNSTPAISSVTPMTGTVQSLVTGDSSAQEQRDAEISHEADVIKELQDVELLPILLDLVESLRMGKLAPKDFDNATGRIRVLLARGKALVNQISGLSESPEAGIEKVGELEDRMERKRAILEEFHKEVNKNFGNSKQTKADEHATVEDEGKMDVD